MPLSHGCCISVYPRPDNKCCSTDDVLDGAVEGIANDGICVTGPLEAPPSVQMVTTMIAGAHR